MCICVCSVHRIWNHTLLKNAICMYSCISRAHMTGVVLPSRRGWLSARPGVPTLVLRGYVCSLRVPLRSRRRHELVA